MLWNVDHVWTKEDRKWKHFKKWELKNLYYTVLNIIIQNMYFF